MKLHLRNISIFIEREIDIADKKITIYKDLSAEGKTSIARTLYAFVSGEVDLSLRKEGSNNATAVLEYNGRKYILTISNSIKKVDMILKEPNRFLVLTEKTPLYNVFLYPQVKTVIRNLLDEYVKPPKAPTVLPPAIESITKMIASYSAKLEEKKKKLEELEKKIAELRKEEMKKKASIRDEDIRQIVSYKSIIEEVERLRNKLARLREEQAKVKGEEISYDQYVKSSEKLQELMEQLQKYYYERDRLTEVINAFNTLAKDFEKLNKYSDILVEYQLYLFDKPLTEETISDLLAELDEAKGLLESEKEKIEKEITRIEEDKAKLTRIVQQYSNTMLKMEEISSEIKTLEDRLKQLETRVAIMNRAINSIEKKYGMSIEEIMKKYEEEKKQTKITEISRLERERQQLLSEIETLKNTIANLERRRKEEEEKKQQQEKLLERYEKEREEYLKKKALFEKTLEETVKDVLRKAKVRDVDVEELELKRDPSTYSESERLIMAFAIQVGLAKALKKIGEPVPYVVVDVIAPLDYRFRRTVIEELKDLEETAIVLETANEKSITYI